MATTNSTPVAETTANNVNNVNPLAPKPIAQNSAKAQRLIKEAEAKKAKAAETKAVKGKGKAVKNNKKDAKAPKTPKVTMASKLDEIILAGGKWDVLVSKANEEGKKLGQKLNYNVGTLKAHIRFRTVAQGKKDYLGKKKISETGIVNITNKK